MENPRVVSRFLLSALALGTAAAVVFSIWYRDHHVLLVWLAGLAVVFVFCIVLAFVNALIFVPIFWLMSRFTPRKEERPVENKLPDIDRPHGTPSTDQFGD